MCPERDRNAEPSRLRRGFDTASTAAVAIISPTVGTNLHGACLRANLAALSVTLCAQARVVVCRAAGTGPDRTQSAGRLVETKLSLGYLLVFYFQIIMYKAYIGIRMIVRSCTCVCGSWMFGSPLSSKQDPPRRRTSRPHSPLKDSVFRNIL